MEHTWRWYGPKDNVSLNDVRQAGATGVVTALHHIANGEVWPLDEILERKKLIESADLSWSVVESIPVHEDIKRRCGDYRRYIDNYKQSVKNLAECGIDTVCYNFMPVVDWTRTDLAYELPDGSRALRFDQAAFTAFDVHILKRPGASDDYSEDELSRAKAYYSAMSDSDKTKLTNNIIAGLPGAEEGYDLSDFQSRLDGYAEIDKGVMRENLAHFLNEVVPVAETVGVRMAIHPDDPPRPLFGLPRIMSTIEDIRWLVGTEPSPSNGITMCTGSYGVRADNDLVDMIQQFGDRVYFTHLRSTQREGDANTFHEASHLGGDVDMYAVVMAMLTEESRRQAKGDERLIPLRPDHGHQILDDLSKQVNPGYSAIGRLKGLAEIRGLELAIKRANFS